MSVTIEFTIEEKAAMRLALEACEDPDSVDRVRRVVYSRALRQYAADRMRAASTGCDDATEEEMALMRAAFLAASASLAKAYHVYPFPFYLLDLAKLLDFVGKTEKALLLYARFTKELRAINVSRMDSVLLSERDPASEVRAARKRFAALRYTHRSPASTDTSQPWWKRC
jgi:hypothetical protein